MFAQLRPPVYLDSEKTYELADLLRRAQIPDESESVEDSFLWPHGSDALANCYLAIVAICHQTSPLGERPLQGMVKGTLRHGWDYLRQRFLLAAVEAPSLADPEIWRRTSPSSLSAVYADAQYGLTLNRVNERSYLLNRLGDFILEAGHQQIRELFQACNSRLGGDKGFLSALSKTVAYSDPLGKKCYFFVSLVVKECGWIARDSESMLSPIDYHELRGHLRIGTVRIGDPRLQEKLHLGLPISEAEDVLLRRAAQEANNSIAGQVAISNSRLHYLLWNVFRSCCPRPAADAHCRACHERCQLPARYKAMGIYEMRCPFSPICESAGSASMLVDPAYVGHFY